MWRRSCARLWYRSLDTAVGFNENYVTRLYLEAGEELRVFVLNGSDVALRDGTRHVWGGGDAALDATTSLYVSTLSGAGTDTCADIDVSRIALPDAFLDAGALPTLHERYGISSAAIAASIKGWLG